MKILLTLLILLLPVVGYGEDFSLAIAAPMDGGIRTVPPNEATRTVYVSSGSTKIGFHVVLTNISGKNQQIWRSDNSWGYDNLSFEWTGTDGKTLKVEREGREWARNIRSFLTVTPGEQNVFDVWFPDDWKDIPSPVKNGEEVTLRAVFAIGANTGPAEFGIWTGTVRSPEVKVRLQGLQ